MKRSEMVRQLEVIMCQFELAPGMYQFDCTDFDKLLDAIEGAGMRPPYDANQDDDIDTMEWEKE